MRVVGETHGARDTEQSHGWCSLRLRFDERELELLRGGERVRGAALATRTRPEVLRTALTLAKAGRTLGSARAGSLVSLDESEVGLFVEALRFASEEVQWAARQQNGNAHDSRSRLDVVMAAFPELPEKGLWRSFGLVRELDALAIRLECALTGGAAPKRD